MCNFNQALEDYGNTLMETDTILYNLCRQHPGHNERRWVFTKVAMIDGCYAVQLSRLIEVHEPRPGDRLLRAAEVLHGQEIADLIETLPEEALPNDETWGTVLEAHGRFVELLRPITRNHQSATSFASKYLHFHCPVVPLFDRNVEAHIRHAVPFHRGEQRQPEAAAGMDDDYHNYLRRFRTFYNNLRGAGTPDPLGINGRQVTLVRLADYILFRGA